jgi:hypothetical protein
MVQGHMGRILRGTVDLGMRCSEYLCSEYLCSEYPMQR